MNKPQNVTKGLLESPPNPETGFIIPINQVQSWQLSVNEPYKFISSGQASADPMENSEQNYVFPRKRKFPDNNESSSPKPNEIYSFKPIDFKPKPPEPLPDSKLARCESSINLTKEIEISTSENSLKNGVEVQTEFFADYKLEKNEDLKAIEKKLVSGFKTELNREIDKLRKILEHQIETGRVLEAQENNQKLHRLKKSFEENLKKVYIETQSTEKIKEIEGIIEKVQNDLKNVGKVEEVQGNLEFVYKQLKLLQEKVEEEKKGYLSGLVNIVPIVQGYMKASTESLDIKLKEIEKRSIELREVQRPYIDQKTFRLSKSREFKNRVKFNYFDACLSYNEFINTVEGYFDRVPRWHRANLLKSLGHLEVSEKDNPFWLEYLRMNYANGWNRYIDSQIWAWVPFEGTQKDKIKHYVINWEFIDCETLNFVRSELGSDQVLVLGGGAFPYRITYLKYKRPAIPAWWNELIQELREGGLQVVLKTDKQSGDAKRIFQIRRNLNKTP